MEDTYMTIKEAERLRLFKNHLEGAISLVKISNLLNISYRHTKRIWRNFKLHGPDALISKKRKNQNRCLDAGVEMAVLSLIRNHYRDYGPTLLSEKLEERHQIVISKESIRKIKIKHGLHQPKKQKEAKVYQRRKRRSCYGELVQMDGLV